MRVVLPSIMQEFAKVVAQCFTYRFCRTVTASEMSLDTTKSKWVAATFLQQLFPVLIIFQQTGYVLGSFVTNSSHLMHIAVTMIPAVISDGPQACCHYNPAACAGLGIKSSFYALPMVFDVHVIKDD
jgi:hypothetical protein